MTLEKTFFNEINATFKTSSSPWSKRRNYEEYVLFVSVICSINLGLSFGFCEFTVWRQFIEKAVGFRKSRRISEARFYNFFKWFQPLWAPDGGCFGTKNENLAAKKSSAAVVVLGTTPTPRMYCLYWTGTVWKAVTPYPSVSMSFIGVVFSGGD